jgi:hypothetical protein
MFLEEGHETVHFFAWQDTSNFSMNKESPYCALEMDSQLGCCKRKITTLDRMLKLLIV